MKKYTIKYEDYSGNVDCVTLKAYSQQHAIGQLFGVKEIYWIYPKI